MATKIFKYMLEFDSIFIIIRNSCNSREMHFFWM